MEEILKMSGVLRGNCCETCHDILQKAPMNGFTKKYSLKRQMHFRNVCSNVLYTKEIFDEVIVGSRFVLFEVKVFIYL